jgi:hypothetical protein
MLTSHECSYGGDEVDEPGLDGDIVLRIRPSLRKALIKRVCVCERV